jgi:hypothetical protein
VGKKENGKINQQLQKHLHRIQRYMSEVQVDHWRKENFNMCDDLKNAEKHRIPNSSCNIKDAFWQYPELIKT